MHHSSHPYKFSMSAHPELAEGYLRALEETLQQVQDERRKNQKSENFRLYLLKRYQKHRNKENNHLFLFCFTNCIKLK